MKTSETTQSKLEKPHTHFDTPDQVVADPALSKQEKEKALDTLEQDARQLSVASDEGMSGGEPTNLQEVLDAKETLESPRDNGAYASVLRDLRNRRATGRQDGTQALIDHAIAALEALERAQSIAGGDLPAGSDAEIARETELEKLDP